MSVARLAVFIVLAFLPAAGGALFPPGDWYRSLAKPAWTPPDAVFAPVWTALYLSIGVAGYLAWRRMPAGRRLVPFSVYGLQLVLNGLWSWLFFGLHHPLLAFVDLAALWILIAATVAAFYAHSRAASALLTPYLVWVAFAGALNFAIVRLNS